MVHELFLANSYEGEVLLLYIIFYMQQHEKCIKRIKIVTITLTITPPRQQCHHMLRRALELKFKGNSLVR
jgi:hypothetical protein